MSTTEESNSELKFQKAVTFKYEKGEIQNIAWSQPEDSSET